MLDRERQFFSENLQSWLSSYSGKFVLIKDASLIGAFDDMDRALEEGARRFGRQSYLIRPVVEQQEEIKIPALTLGILRANPTHSGQR